MNNIETISSVGAMKLALEALENTASRSASEQFVIEQHAIAFIKKALDEIAPAPVAKNEEGRITWLADDWPQNCFLYAEPPTWTPVEIGVDVTSEGANVVGMYVLPDAVRYVFYSQLHPVPPRQPLTDEQILEIFGVHLHEDDDIEEFRHLITDARHNQLY